MKIDPEKLYTLKELTQFWFSESTWRRRIKKKEITHIKLGGVYFVEGKEIIKYVEMNTIFNDVKI